MRLSKIKMAGFKSFVDPTTIRFGRDLVAVVGPNGCGKSNVIDAVRWVMGESSKHLRGDTMEDVIFNGSSARKPVAQASIELVFDNGDGAIGGQYAHYSEIAVRREVARDGQSRYLLNGTKCRRRDITDIFLGTGLGARSYAIIEQGMITRLIEAKPEELRVHLEEAAGISRYRERRRETENRIRHTRENLERLDDLREEVDKQLNHLKRQASAAERYKTLKQEHQRARAELLALRWQAQDGEARERERALEAQTTRVEEVLAELRAGEAAVETARAEQVQAQDTLNAAQAEYYRLGSEVARLEQSVQHTKDLRARQHRELDSLRETHGALERELASERERLEALDQDLGALTPETDAASAAHERERERLEAAETALADWQTRWEALAARAAEPEQTAYVERTRLEHLEQGLAQARTRAQRLQAEQADLDEAPLRAASARLQERGAAAAADLASRQEALGRTHTGIEQQRQDNETLDTRQREAQAGAQDLRAQLTSLEALQTAALGAPDEAVGQWLAEHELDEAPRLAERLSVDAHWSRAAEVVLDGTLQAVCVPDLAAVTQAAGRLSQGHLTVIEAGASKAVTPHAPGARLAGKVEGPAALGELLDGVYVAADLDEARALCGQLAAHESVVTVDGVWMGKHWLRVARGFESDEGVLNRKAEIERVQDEVALASEAAARIRAELETGQQKLRELEHARETRQAETNEAHRLQAQLDSELRTQKGRLEQCTTRRAELARELEELHTQSLADEAALAQSKQDRAHALEALERFAAERDTLQAERERLQADAEERRAQVRAHQERAHELALRMESLRSTRVSVAESLERLERQRSDSERRTQELEAALQDAETPLASLQQELDGLLSERQAAEHTLTGARQGSQTLDADLRERERARVEVERRLEAARGERDALRMAWQEVNARRQALSEQFAETGLSLQTVCAELEQGATVATWEAHVDKLASRLERLGPINLAAIDEYQEQSERKTYLDSQHQDLSDALATLESAIRKIDRETRQRFRETFERVNTRLQETFPRLFGGGAAHLEMTGDDLLTTGVAIMARPPGKRLSTIHLMSGGEKALTAVALVFAIFELNPAPFCLLDEVDAPLDEANVGRFCELVAEMSARVQFVLITHNKTTMELTQQLIGVTMNEPGVSRLVAVDVDAAAQMAAG